MLEALNRILAKFTLEHPKALAFVAGFFRHPIRLWHLKTPLSIFRTSPRLLEAPGFHCCAWKCIHEFELLRYGRPD